MDPKLSLTTALAKARLKEKVLSSNKQSFATPTKFATALTPIHVKKSTSMQWVTTRNRARVRTSGLQQFVAKDSASSAAATPILGQTVQLEHRSALTVA
ncbi:hypothetical protein MRX96_021246 [Rhipicephalus microplus]